MDVKTRWNSTYHMLKRLIQVKNEYNATMEFAERYDEILTSEQLDMMKAMCDLLVDFEEISIRISSAR